MCLPLKSGRGRGLPSTTAATIEFVVPRSIPITGPALLRVPIRPNIIAPMPAELTDVQRAMIDNAHAALGRSSYYELLGLPRSATKPEIQAAFDRFCSTLHPDLYYTLEDQALLARIKEVFGRLSEAYRVLCDHELRVAYHRALNKGDKRLDPATIGAIKAAARRKASRG